MESDYSSFGRFSNLSSLKYLSHGYFPSSLSTVKNRCTISQGRGFSRDRAESTELVPRGKAEACSGGLSKQQTSTNSPTMNAASALCTPPSSPGPNIERLQMAPQANREPRRSVNASHDAIMRHLMATINEVENVVIQPAAKPILRTPEKTHKLPLPPAARQFGFVAPLEPLSREEAFIRTPRVHRRRAPPKFRVHQIRNFTFPSPKARLERKHLPKAVNRMAPSRFQNFRDLEAMHKDTKSRPKHFEQIAANTCQRRLDRVHQLEQLLKKATSEEEKNAIYNEYYL
uniref:TPX2 domain-containing protein n=1 Tax=Panagrellus redivivus TaxID=6233 RepID=A0A7E4W4W6_PANRE